MMTRIDTNVYTEQIADFIAGISTLDRQQLAYVVIATDWSEGLGL